MQVRAKHLLVENENICEAVKDDITSGAMTFDAAAAEYSQCPSGREGGDLGWFGKGQMVPEFEEICFSGEAGVVYGPVATQFGYHLILITDKK